MSGKETFYTDIIEPLGYEAKEMNDDFNKKKAELVNQMTKKFSEEYCNDQGVILWKKIVEFNSNNR